MTDEDFFQMMAFLPEKMNKCISLLAETYFKDTELKVYFIPYIIDLRAHDGMSQKELNRLIPCDKSRISVVIHELMDRGLVYNDGKGRNSSLHLTDKGLGAYSVSRMFVDLVNKELFSGFSDRDSIQKQFSEFDSHMDTVLLRLTERSGQ